jgi:hypothetical protein
VASLIRRCAAPGCSILTMGAVCLEHEPSSREPLNFPRGRPYTRRHIGPAREQAHAPTGQAAARLAGRLACLAVIAVVLSVASATARGSLQGARSYYPVHTRITATVFWIGEPVGSGSTENNAVSAYDDRWLKHYGGVDDYRSVRRYPYFPHFVPRENPFYLDVPYDDFLDSGEPRPDRTSVVPWAAADADALALAAKRDRPFSLLKNRWVKLSHRRNGVVRTCFGQVEDAGPYVYDDARYVFGRGDPRPQSRRANSAGLDVSPALRDCLGFVGLDNDSNRVDWEFVDEGDVSPGPWRRVVTTRQVFWP